jgi:hypothetical protein
VDVPELELEAVPVVDPVDVAVFVPEAVAVVELVAVPLVEAVLVDVPEVDGELSGVTVELAVDEPVLEIL